MAEPRPQRASLSAAIELGRRWRLAQARADGRDRFEFPCPPSGSLPERASRTGPSGFPGRSRSRTRIRSRSGSSSLSRALVAAAPVVGVARGPAPLRPPHRGHPARAERVRPGCDLPGRGLGATRLKAFRWSTSWAGRHERRAGGRTNPAVWSATQARRSRASASPTRASPTWPLATARRRVQGGVPLEGYELRLSLGGREVKLVVAPGQPKFTAGLD